MHSRAQSRAQNGAVPSRPPTTWPVRSGPVPPLADSLSSRPETAPQLSVALVPGTVLALAPDQTEAGRARSWLGSAGKTQLAVSAAETLWRSGALELLVWITATSRASILAGYTEAATAAMGVAPDGDAETVAVRFARWLAESGRSWLMVLDDLASLSDLDGLWPGTGRGRILITTADQGILTGLRQATVLPVGVFTPREALSYLMARLAADPDQRLGAIDLAKDLACEPMALAQASAVIASSSQTCRDYRIRLARRQEQLAEMIGQEPSTAAHTWTLSVDMAERLAPSGGVELLLALAALVDGHEIPGAFFTAPAVCGYLSEDNPAEPGDSRRAWDGVLSLERAGLVVVDPPARSHPVRMNMVVQEAVRAAMPEPMLERTAVVAADALLQIWPEEEPHPWEAASLRACVDRLRQLTGTALWHGGCHPVLMRAGHSLDLARMTGSAVAYWRELAAANDRLLGSAHTDTLAAGQHLADAYLAAGQVPEAVSAHQWVLAGRARILGPDHPSIVAGQIRVGHALVAAGQPADAIPVLDEAVVTCERVHGGEDAQTLNARSELAAAHAAAGQYSEAIVLYKRILADRDRIQGGRHADTITARQRLADSYLADGQNKPALSQHKRALADRERTGGPEHPDTMTARTKLGTTYYAMGRMTQALQQFEQVRNDSERLLGADHPATLARRANLANAYYAVGRLSDAKTLLQDTALRCEQILPPGDPLIQAVQESLDSIS